VAAAREVGPLAERLVPPAQRRVIRRLARLAAGAP
jgi:hypothetical protein